MPVLDGLRGVAIVPVMLYHFTGGTDNTATGLGLWFSRVTGVGWIGVDLFFVLSGFLITGILLDSRGSERCLRNFYARRSLRIFPLYFGVLVLLFVVLPLVPGLFVPGLAGVSENQFWLWTYTSNIARFFEPSLVFHAGWIQTVHFWSLAVEEQFYLVWPIVVVLARPGTLVRWCVAVTAASLVLRAVLLWLEVGTAVGVSVFTPCRLEGLMIGALLAVVVRSGWDVARLAPIARMVGIGCGVPLAVVWMVVGLEQSHWTMQSLGFTMIALVAGSVLVLSLAALPGSVCHAVLSNSVLRQFGKYSYGLYVFHYMLSPLMGEFLSVEILIDKVFGHYWPARLASVAIQFAASFALAWISWHVFEKHFLGLKRHFEPVGTGERPLRVVVASSGLGHVSRGIEAWAHDLGYALRARGVEVLLCKGGGSADAEFERVLGCWTRESAEAQRVVRWLPRALAWRLCLGSGYGVEQATFAWSLLKVLRSHKADVVHVQDPLVAILVQRARRMGLVSTRVVLAHGTEEPASFLRKVEFVQHLAPWHGDECRREGAWRESWAVIPNFVDCEQFAPGASGAMRRELGIPEDALVVLTAAAIKKKHKRIDWLLDECAAVLRDSPSAPVWLVIAGGQERETAELVEYGTRLLGDRVRFLVRFPRERMAELYRCADVFVLASLKEMMPIALLEAIASGLPCVVNRHPVMEWMVGPGGRAIDMQTRGELAATLGELVRDGAQRRALGARAREHCAREFGKDVIVEQIAAYYGRVAGAVQVERAAALVDQIGVERSPSVSVVIPAYNSAAWIVEAVESVLAQSVPAQEIIVVDDGSTDDTASRLAPFAGRVTLLRQENQGVSVARNAGVARASGDLIAFLDADDVWHPKKLEIQVAAFVREPALALVGTGVVDWPGSFGADASDGRSARVGWHELAVKNRLTTSSVMVRRAVLASVGGFDSHLRGPEDLDLWLRVAEVGQVAVLGAELVGYRTISQSLGRRVASMEAGLSRVLHRIDERGTWHGRWLLRRKSFSYWRYSCAFMHAEAGDYRTALARIVRSFALYPIPYRAAEVRLPLARLRLLSMIVRRALRPQPKPSGRTPHLA